MARPVALECLECGKRFSRKNPIDPRCPRCRGVDIDLALPADVASVQVGDDIPDDYPSDYASTYDDLTRLIGAGW